MDILSLLPDNARELVCAKSMADARRARRVCKAWNQYFPLDTAVRTLTHSNSTPPNWYQIVPNITKLRVLQALPEAGTLTGLHSLTSIDLRDNYRLYKPGMALLQPLTSLLCVNLTHCENVTNGALAELRHLTNLTSLVIDRCHCLTDAGAPVLRTLSRLTHLSMVECFVTEAGLQNLPPTLKQLNLAHCQNVRALPPLPLGLTELNLERCPVGNLTEALAPLSKLSCVNMSDMSFNNNSSVLAAVNHTTCLTRLNMRYTRPPDWSLLGRLTTLKWLNVSSCNASVLDLATALRCLSELVYLNIGYNTASDLSVLDELVNLRVLSLSGINNGFDLTTLGAPVSRLSLSNSVLSYSNTTALLHLTSVSALDLSSCVFEDNKRSALESLARMQQLTSLNMSKCDITVDDLQLLLPLSASLNELDVSCCEPLENGVVLPTLSSFSRLTSLDMCGVNFTRREAVQALSALTVLRTLYASDYVIEDVGQQYELLRITIVL
jgi:F-box and leucine-rich repeat protein 14